MASRCNTDRGAHVAGRRRASFTERNSAIAGVVDAVATGAVRAVATGAIATVAHATASFAVAQ